MLKESSFGLLIDAKNSNGGAVEKLPLPLKDFQKVDILLQQILNTTADSSFGYTFEMTKKTLTEFTIVIKTSLSICKKENIDKNFLSDFQINLLETMGIKRVKNTEACMKNKKKNYTVHYLNLYLYDDLRMIIKKVHRILQFTQSR